MIDCAAATEDPTPQVTREQMRHVLEVSRTLAVSSDLDALLMRIARAATAMLGCERASVFLHDPLTDELWTRVALQSEPIRVPADSGIVGWAFGANQVIQCGDAYADPRFNPEPDRRSGFITRDLLAAPMVDWDDKPVGVLQAVNKIRSPFAAGDGAFLRLLADQAGMAVQRWLLQQDALRSSGLRHEMKLAKRVQEAMIPRHPPAMAGLICAGWTRPASINGGDCYDLWACGEKLGVLMADASGHGIGPALVVSQVRALVRALCEIESDPLKLLLRINDRLAADLEPGKFVTAFVGFISRDGWLHWCSAGQSPVVLCEPGKPPRELRATWSPVGLMRDLPGDVAEPVLLAPGATLVVLSDGITEAFSPAQEMWGVERAISVLAQAQGREPGEIVSAVRDAVIAWQQKEEPVDDQTVVVVRRGAATE